MQVPIARRDPRTGRTVLASNLVVWVRPDGNATLFVHRGGDIYDWAPVPWEGIGGGSQGPQGPAGVQGPPGTDGLDGVQGPQGIQGPPGADGIDGADGPAGAQGPQGAQGPAGPQGEPGLDGANGAQGIQGPQGPAGLDGAAGAQGIQGPAGANGAQGSQGIQGPAGSDGAQGPAGPAPAGTGFVTVTGGVLDTPSATIAQSAITGFVDALAAKAATTHTHAAADITSGLAAVATSGSASDLGAGTLLIARIAANAVTLDKLVRGASAGHVLTANGSGADLTFQAPAGGDDARLLVAALASDQADITGTGLVEITGLTKTVGVGTWRFSFAMIYQTTATTTGVEFVVDHTGTDTAFVSNARFGSTGGAAATGIADQVGVGTAAGIMEVKTQRTAGSRPGVTIGVDTINANCLMIVEGVIRVSVSGDLKILMAAELAGLVCRAKAGSCVTIVKCGAT